jgi:hypothetical protein
VLDWLKAQLLGWQHAIRNTLRFFMGTSNQPVPPSHEFDSSPKTLERVAPQRDGGDNEHGVEDHG